MKRLDDNAIPDLECDRCKAKINPNQYTQEFGDSVRFDYTHICSWWPTLEELPPKELK